MIKFKPGDRVVVIPHEENSDGVPVGASGTVLESSPYPYVEMDDKSLNRWLFNGNVTGAILSQNELELLKYDVIFEKREEILTASLVESIIKNDGYTKDNIKLIQEYGIQCAKQALKNAAGNLDLFEVDKLSLINTEIITP